MPIIIDTRYDLCHSIPSKNSKSSRQACRSRHARRVEHDQGVYVPNRALSLGKRAVRRYPSTGSQPSSAKQISKIRKRHVKKAGELVELSTHSFLPSGAVSRALAGDSASTFTQRAFWKTSRTALRYMRLMEVVSPGAEGSDMAEGISQNQYREFKRIPSERAE